MGQAALPIARLFMNTKTALAQRVAAKSEPNQPEVVVVGAYIVASLQFVNDSMHAIEHISLEGLC